MDNGNGSAKTKKLGTRAKVLSGPHAGFVGRVVARLSEEDEHGIPVQGGLSYHVLQSDNMGKIAFRREEIQILR
ncbi:MAG: KOW motif-containing protein [Candidatus Yanofskybacteria bacterium]|nr:KOW motif-containing protein [Candidatus Yanofskybacteria bacterium]